MKKHEYWDKYEELSYDDGSRRAHRRRKGEGPRSAATRAERRAKRVAELTDFDDSVIGFVPSYVANMDPAHHERNWVVKSLTPFYQNNQIVDVMRLVKGGKEANVYWCEAQPETGMRWLAAKLYRPRMLRHLKNDAMYKEGRMTLDGDGQEARKSRDLRALQKKTRYGQHLDFMTWIVHEFRTQALLYEAGGAVPRPLAHGGNVILMEYIGDEYGPAPTLSEVRLPEEEGQLLFDKIVENVRLMLAHHYVHGDLSPYNILYWESDVVIIDFPQLVDARVNQHALGFLTRDLRRVYDYFAPLGVMCEPEALAAQMWKDYEEARL
ncbi:MAG TPA: RIO1 family regulatory kinase/ATPase [Anaerolineae bacterium]|nr:RIO1 family regulatory kinase/ATPase [Anaerolineae bacterium]